MLELRGLARAFGGVRAVDDLSFEVRRGEVFALIGPNGSGKTTTVNCITGLMRPSAGQVLFDGSRISGFSPDRIVRRGVARTFQNIRLFAELTVLQNIRAAQCAACRGIAAWGTPWAGAAERRRHAAAEALLERLGLVDMRDNLAGSLTYGAQKRLEIARALASSPRVLLLDEPAGGIGSGELAKLATLIAALRAEGMGILLIEHNVRFVMDISDRVAVLNFGQLIALGEPQAVRRDPAVIEAYLGRE